MRASSLFKELGKYLRKKRMEAGISQVIVAKKLGYSSAQFISNCERGLCGLPLKKLKIIVKLYKISPKELTDLLVAQHRRHIERYLSKAGSRRVEEPSTEVFGA